jgi:hypothetical protein
MRRPGVEPGQTAWKAVIIPLDHQRIELEQIKGF